MINQVNNLMGMLRVDKLTSIMQCVPEALGAFEDVDTPDIRILEGLIDVLANYIDEDIRRQIAMQARQALGNLNLDDDQLDALRDRLSQKLGV